MIDQMPILAELARTGKLHGSLARAAVLLTADQRNADGRSMPVSKYDNMPRGPAAVDSRIWHTEAQDRLDRLKTYLRPHERLMLAEISHHDPKPWLRIMALGAASGYKDAEKMRAAGVAFVLALLQSVAAFYASIGYQLPNRHIKAYETPHERHAA